MIELDIEFPKIKKRPLSKRKIRMRCNVCKKQTDHKASAQTSNQSVMTCTVCGDANEKLADV